MGNFIDCCRRSNALDPLPNIPTSSSSGISGRNTSGKGYSECSSSGNSGYSFGEQRNLGESFLPASGEILERPNLRTFSYSELKSAARNFRAEAVLGEGGFGKVYKGWIDDEKGQDQDLHVHKSKSGSKITVAIKRLNSESVQGFEEWQSEINFLGRLTHPNLVKLLGYCWEDEELLLVYEYMPKGNLENHLFKRNPSMEPLSWNRRMSIALGIAKGMAFLHSSDIQVIYRDFKTSNILLDVNYNAKISDFGLAKMGPSGENSHVTTRVMGTYGYAAPEYVATGHLYMNSDVYGFGVVLLEMLTGLRALDMHRPCGRQNLVEWMKPRLSNKKKLRTIIDSRLEGQYVLNAAFELAQLTLKCLVMDHKSRPSMKEVVGVLEKVEAIKAKPKETGTKSGQHATPMSKKLASHHSPHYGQRKDVGR